jgi:hypothetical protein
MITTSLPSPWSRYRRCGASPVLLPKRATAPLGWSARVAAVALLCAACAGNPGQAEPLGAGPRPSSAGVDALRPGDKVRLKIWREPDLSGDFDVDENGRVLLPKIGPFDVGQIPADSAKRAIVASYQTLLRNPTVDVLVLRRINVLGAVRAPGLYPVDPTMTVADVLALAGGAASDGRPDQVRLIRDGQRMTVRLTGGTRISETPIRGGDQLFVPQRGWFSRNLPFVVGTTLGVTGLLVRFVTD